MGRIVSRKELNWKNNKLYHFTKFIGFSVQKDDTMWKVQFPDKILSEDHYNLSWAKEHASRQYLTIKNGLRMAS